MSTYMPWLQLFPGNFMWSQGMLLAIEAIPWRGAAFHDVLQVADQLQGDLGDNRSWYEAWSSMAARIEAAAQEEASRGHQVTAGDMYHRAATYHFLGERFLSPDDPDKTTAYKSVLRAFSHAAAIKFPRLEFVEVPYEGSSLPAHFLPPNGAPPYRVMVFFDGLDICKEILSSFAAIEMAKRGIGTLVVDGPGQGESLRLRDIPSRYDYEVPAAAAVDYLETRSDTDPQRIGVMAISMGGYYAPRAAAYEKRFKLLVAWGAHFDYKEVWRERWRLMQEGGTTTSAPSFQLPWVLGVPTMDAAMAKLDNYNLIDAAKQITCPTLITHGYHDSIVPVEMAHRLYKAIPTQHKTLKIFDTDEGGSEHCMEDNRQVGTAYVADWIADHL